MSDQPEKQGLWGPINVSTVAQVVIACVAALYFIDWAEPILLPLAVAVLISYALDPVVSLFDRIGLPRPISAAIVLVGLLACIGGAVVPLQQETSQMLDKIPRALEQFQRDTSRRDPEPSGIMEKAQKAAEQIQETAKKSQAEPPRQPGVTPVRIVPEPFSIRDYLMEGSSAGLVMASQIISVLLLVYFLLAVGKLYRRQLVHMAGPEFHRMRKAAYITREFHQQIRRFLFITLLSALFVGVATWVAFLIMGVEQAIFWGVVAGVASAIPYLGPFMVAIGSAGAAFIQFGTLEMTAIVSLVSLVITSIQGYLLMPWLTSQVASLNAVATFIGLLFWGWIWGPVGLIIAAPILMITKTLCDHVRNLKPLGDLMGK